MKRLFLAFLVFLVWCSDLEAQAPFYQGKTIRVVVGFSPGGTNDLWARAIARYWTRHIRGNPEFIVQNMAGAGSWSEMD